MAQHLTKTLAALRLPSLNITGARSFGGGLSLFDAAIAAAGGEQ